MSEESMSQMSKATASRLDTFTNSLEATKEAGKSVDDVLKAGQVAENTKNLLSEAEDNSAMGIQIRTKKLDIKKDAKTEKAKQAQESVLVRKEDADGMADGFSQRHGNREYRIDPRLLSQLAEDVGIGINEHSKLEEMISFVRKRMTVDRESPDVAIVDKAFEFLIEMTRLQADKATGVAKERLENIQKNLEAAKFKHFTTETNAADIQVAQKIIGAVDAVVETTGQPVKATLDHYRDVVHNPPDIQTLRKYYETKGYREMILELSGLNTFLGGNLKRKNLESPELGQLVSAARKMQGILGVFEQIKLRLTTLRSFLGLSGVMKS